MKGRISAKDQLDRNNHVFVTLIITLSLCHIWKDDGERISMTHAKTVAQYERKAGT